tara:strand:+ start:438 stop:623 length:186 start_codon:yes stop_codon:yes gene_type:complete
MKYEKNKSAYQDAAWFERERNVLDVRNWNRDLMGQTFYQTCHDNKKNTEQSSSSGIHLWSH